MIADLHPDLVSMTWTEDPALDKDATGPLKGQSNLSFIASLRSMQGIAEQAQRVALTEKRARRFYLSSELESFERD